MQRHKWHSSIGKLQKAALNSEINVTPLVDVCLVLLIIFMVVTPLIQSGIAVNVPITDEPSKHPEDERQLMLGVKQEGPRVIIYGGANVVDKTQFEGWLKEVHQKTPDREIVIKGDKAVKYQEVLDLMKACREVGFQNVGLIAMPKKR